MLAVSDGHHIYVERSGNPDGVPVLVVHGGPGGGSSPMMRRFFDPEHYHIILFDQRGCGLSTPHASCEANTTWHLVEDMARIRSHLGLGRMVLFGGSWGATLALIYAITHPDHVSHLVLRGVFTMTQAELDWFYGGGVARFFPELWQRFVAPLPEDERDNIVAAYHRRLHSGNFGIEAHHARIWSAWENALSTMRDESQSGWHEPPVHYARAFARLESHYFHNHGFLPEDGWILKNRHRIEGIGADIIQGRYDMICPPTSAYALAEGWQKARLQMVGMAGHALSEPGLAGALVTTMNRLRHP